MKTFLAILFIALIFTAQYAKQLSYMGCKVFATKDNSCNCEKIMQPASNPSSNDLEHNNKQHKHIQVEDYVQQTQQQAKVTLMPASIINKHLQLGATTLLFGYKAALLKPPIG